MGSEYLEYLQKQKSYIVSKPLRDSGAFENLQKQKSYIVSKHFGSADL